MFRTSFGPAAAGMEMIDIPMGIGIDQIGKRSSLSLLTIPLHIRENIYRQLLSINKTRVTQVHRDWDFCEALDSDYNSPIPTGLPDPLCPRVTKYNFDTNVLRVNRQIHQEASPFLGWKNQWVLIRVGEPSLVKELEETGAAIPISDAWTLAASGTVNRPAIEIMLTGTENGDVTNQHQMIMGIEGIWDLVALLISGNWEPWCIMVRISKEYVSPQSEQIENRVMKMFQPLRIRKKAYNATARNPGPLMMLEILDGESYQNIPIAALRQAFQGHEVLFFLRTILAPYPNDRESIDWEAEEMVMSEWTFFFSDALTKYADTLVNERIASLWRDTLCMAHARLMVISLGLRRWEEAEFHSRRTWEMMERISPMIWYYRRAMHVMGENRFQYSKDVTDEIMDVGWCLSRLENRDWMEFLWLWGRDSEKAECDMMAMLSHKMEAARLLAGSGPGSWEKKVAIFDRLMENQVNRVISHSKPAHITELFKQKNNIAEEATLDNSLENNCIHLSVPMWYLN